MVTSTRSKTRSGGFEAQPSASSTKDITSLAPKRTPASVKAKLPTIKEPRSLRAPSDVDLPPQNVGDVFTKSMKRKLDESEEESDEGTKTYPTNITPSKDHRTNVIASSTNKNSNNDTTEAIPSRNVIKIGFASVEEMALKNFTRILAGKGINVRKTETQEFSNLEVDGSEHQAALYWKTFPGSTPSSAKLPDTATFGECSVFAVETNTKEKFEEKAKRFLGRTMGLKTMKRSMALVLHYDGHGKLKSAIVGYPLGRDLHYSDSLKAETAKRIAMELNRGKGPERWHLEVPREGPPKKRTLVGTGGRGHAKDESDTSID